MCLVCGIPFVVTGEHIGLKATGNGIGLAFFSHKAVNIGLPIQHQRLIIDVQLLRITICRSDGQNDSFANSIAFLIGSNCTVGESRDLNLYIIFYRRLIRGNGQRKGNSNILIFVSVMTDANLSHLSAHCITGQRKDIVYLAVNRDRKRIRSGTHHLKFYAFAKNCVDCILIKFILGPTVLAIDLKASALAIILAALLDHTEIIVYIVDLEAQHCKEAVCIGTIIVLNDSRKGSIFAIDPVPTGVAAGIIGIQNAMCLVCSIPFISSTQLQTGLKGTGNCVGLAFFCSKAVNISLPTQHQRLAIDVQLLGIAISRSNCQSNFLTNSVILFIGNNCAIFEGIDCKIDCFLRFNENMVASFAGNSSRNITVICFRSMTFCCYQLCITYSTSLCSGAGCVSTGGMALRGYQLCITYGAGLCSGAGCVSTGGMALGCYQLCITYGAGLCSGAGCVSTGSVTLCCCQNFLTRSTSLRLCASRFGAGLMALGRYQLCITYSTNLCVGASCFCAGSVTLCCHQNFVARSTSLRLGTGRFGTGLMFCAQVNFTNITRKVLVFVFVTLCRYQLCITYRADLCLGAGCFCAGSMSLGRYQLCITYSTNLCVGASCLCARSMTTGRALSCATLGTSLGSSTSCIYPIMLTSRCGRLLCYRGLSRFAGQRK